MSSKQKLIDLVVQKFPLDQVQQKAAIEGINNLTDVDAEQITQQIEEALNDLPQVLTRLETLLKAEEA